MTITASNFIAWIIVAGKIAGSLTAIGVCVYGFWTRFYRPFRQSVKETTETLEVMQRLAPTLEVIAAEFRPNGGSTFRDAVDRIADDVGQLKHRVGAVEKAVLEVKR
jgi:hypothetical protein